MTFIEPDYGTIAEFTGTSNDYHPHGNILVGEGYVAEVYEAVKASPQWDRTVFVVNFDENGGFYDHVAPPTVEDDNVNPNPGPHPDYTRLGFRVPAIAIGPFAPKKIEIGGPVRALLDPADDRVAVGPRADDGARRERQEPGRGARLLDRPSRVRPAGLPDAPEPGCPSPSIALA